MAKAVPLALYVEDAEASYFACKKQAIDVHAEPGTQRLLDLQKKINQVAKKPLHRENGPSIENNLELEDP